MKKELGCKPWVDMWTKPQKTIKALVKSDPNYQIWWLAAFYGFCMLLQISQTLSLGASFSLLLIVASTVILAAPIGMLGFLIMSKLVYWMSKWLGGVGTFEEVRASLAWSKVTNIPTAILWIVLIAMNGYQVFFSGFPQAGTITQANFMAVSLIHLLQAVLGVWSFVLFFRALAAVQQFSVWRSIVSIILPFIIITIALWELLVFIFWAIGMKG